jgi:transcriptional regulator with XRE-family HTH domain
MTGNRGTGAALIVSANVRALRRARRWTQAELADRIGLGWSKDTAGQAENGRRVWTANEIAVAAEVFGVTPGSLFEANCDQCHGAPPPGFTCNACGAAS